VFELKYDACRALAHVEKGRCQLISRNKHAFASFEELSKEIGNALSPGTVVLDGEIVCIDSKGRPQFKDLLFRRGNPCFFAFDLLYSDGKDWRRDGLVDRKAALAAMIRSLPVDSRLKYADHVERARVAIYEPTCPPKSSPAEM